MPYDIESLAYGFTTEQGDIISLPLTHPQYIFDRESTYEENYYGKIDAWWRFLDGALYSTDAKSDRKVNRNDDERSGEISTAEFVGISGHRGSIHGRSIHMDLRQGKSFKKFKRDKLVELCHACQLNTPQDAIRKFPNKSIGPNLFYYRAEHPDELLFNFLWSKALELPHRSYPILDEFLAREGRFLDYIKSRPKTMWKMNDYGGDLRTIKRLWYESNF